MMEFDFLDWMWNGKFACPICNTVYGSSGGKMYKVIQRGKLNVSCSCGCCVEITMSSEEFKNPMLQESAADVEDLPKELREEGQRLKDEHI